MCKALLRIVWNALPLVAIALVAWWAYGVVHARIAPPPVLPSLAARPVVLEAVKRVNKQVFIEHYHAVDIDYTEAPENWLRVLGLKQEFVVLLRGRVPAGFDLQELDEGDVWVSSDGRRAQLTLSAPVIFLDNVSVDWENSRILAWRDTCPWFLCRDPLVTYQSTVLPAGRDLLVQAARQHGILDQAARGGQEFYAQLLRSLGFAEVRVVVTGYGAG